MFQRTLRCRRTWALAGEPQTIMAWRPNKEVTVLVSEGDREAYLAGRGPFDQWLHRVGRHERHGEFPVMVVRQFLRDQGYDVYVSGLSKAGLDSYSLAMFPGQRQDAAFKNTLRVPAGC